MVRMGPVSVPHRPEMIWFYWRRRSGSGCGTRWVLDSVLWQLWIEATKIDQYSAAPPLLCCESKFLSMAITPRTSKFNQNQKLLMFHPKNFYRISHSMQKRRKKKIVSPEAKRKRHIHPLNIDQKSYGIKMRNTMNKKLAKQRAKKKRKRKKMKKRKKNRINEVDGDRRYP